MIKKKKVRSGAGKVDKELGRRLKAERIVNKMSQTKVGDLVGISFQQVQKYEAGTNKLSAAMLLKFSAALKFKISTFLEGIEK